jgi:hypothetical protein
MEPERDFLGWRDKVDKTVWSYTMECWMTASTSRYIYSIWTGIWNTLQVAANIGCYGQ